MKLVSFPIQDVDQVQEMVTQPLGDVDAWDIRYCQTERGTFTGSYTGAALPSERSPYFKNAEEASQSSTNPTDSLASAPAVYWSRHIYNRRLHVTGRAPMIFAALIIPVRPAVEMRYNGLIVARGQLIALAPGAELDLVLGSNTDALSLRLAPSIFLAIQSALANDVEEPMTGLITPDEPLLRALTDRLCCSLAGPTETNYPASVAAMRALAVDVEDGLISILQARSVPRDRVSLRRHRSIGKIARGYLEANLTRQVAITELCAVTGASERTLHSAFKRCYGTSPASYHKYQRLKFARDDLQRFCTTEASVTQVALARGFSHLGRFAFDYKSVFREHPSETLNSPCPHSRL